MPEQHQPATPSSPVGVSYVMPVLNDATHVRAAVESILAQDYAGPVEVLIALRKPAPSRNASSISPSAISSCSRWTDRIGIGIPGSHSTIVSPIRAGA